VLAGAEAFVDIALLDGTTRALLPRSAQDKARRAIAWATSRQSSTQSVPPLFVVWTAALTACRTE